jgi:transposase
MLKIVYPTCCGIDVHKTFVVACIASTNDKGVTTYQSKRFSTYTKNLRELSDWLAANNCKDVCMESTGKYWHPVWNVLELACRPVLAHPKYLKAIRGKKTDKKDAKWIADVFKHDLVSGSFIPPAIIRQLRDLMRYRFKLTNYKTGEKNRAQNCLTTSNIQLDHAFSDVFGKSATAILNHLLEHPGEIFDVAPFIDRRCKTPVEEIQLSIDGNISHGQAEKLKIIRSHMDSLELCKANLESAILTLAEPLLPQINLVSSVPGIKDFSAIAVIAEIGADMSVFPTAKHLCSWAGLAPQCNESGGKKKSSRVSRAGVYIKPLLVQCANAVVKSNKHPEIRNRYLSIKKRRGHKKAIIAIARMLLTAIFHILKKNEPYNPELYRQSDASPVDPVEQAVKMLEKRGFVVSQTVDDR